MGRPIYAQELNDPDFQWLLSSFKSSHPGFIAVEAGNLPVVLLECEADAPSVAPLLIPHNLGAEEQE